jgi:hypothetical protein
MITKLSLDKYMKSNRVSDCNCKLIQCACVEARKHQKNCRYRIALICAIPITCEHGLDVCTICDPCTCGELNFTKQDIN